MAIEINKYTGNYQSALNPSAPEIGEEVQVSESCDAREYDDFMRVLKKAGLELVWDSWDEEEQANCYRVEKWSQA
jgi:hypothetical protein